jgi:hypothetical protein
MFTCADRELSKGDLERASVGLAGNIEIFSCTRSPRSRLVACQDGIPQVRRFSVAGQAFASAVVVASLLARWAL